MATVTAFIRTTKTDRNKSVNIRFRLRDGRDFQLFHKSEFSIIPDKWDTKQQKIKSRCIIDEQERKIFDTDINDRKALIKSIYLEKGKKLTSDLLDTEIDKVFHPEGYETSPLKFFDVFDEFLKLKKFSNWRYRAFQVVIRAMKRYELYIRLTKDKLFLLDFDSITSKTLNDFDSFLRNEYLFFEQYPTIYKAIPESRPPKQRGQNTINGIFTKIRTLFLWANKEKITTNNPFESFEIKECVYGTPFYISVEERNLLYNTDFSSNTSLEIQRDIFVFQCLVGCRVADLYKLKKGNIINGAVEYIAGKTKDDRPITVRVPLNSTAKEIISKYKNYEGKSLLPFIAQQNYNYAIKEIFTIANLTRPVVTLDQLTRESVIRPLNEIASSHLARRCFVGNLYRRVKDPNLVGALSGHKEGSRAFLRYRQIDEDMKQELVKMLE